ncbi:MAG: CopD family protein [Gammaproteobacteria bacterium]
MGTFFVFATWLDVLAISACIGALVCVCWVLPRNAPVALKETVWAGFGWATGLLTVASGVLLASRTLEFSGAALSGLGHFLPLVLKRTQYGLIWSWRMGAVGVLWLCWLSGRHRLSRRTVECLAGGALLVVVFSRSATGHAGDQGIFSGAVWVDGLHVVAGAVWVGSLFTMSSRVMPWFTNVAGDQRTLVVEVFERLSAIAGAALLVIVITGTLNAWEGLGKIGSLWDSRYGQILSVKLTLVAWMVGIGAHNRYVKLPALARWANRTPRPRPPGARLFRPGARAFGGSPKPEAGLLRVSARAVNTESLLGIGVLVAAALLHHAMPPKDKRHLGNETSLSKPVLTNGIAQKATAMRIESSVVVIRYDVKWPYLIPNSTRRYQASMPSYGVWSVIVPSRSQTLCSVSV